MKIRTFLTLGTTLILTLLAVEPAMAQRTRTVGHYAPELLIILLALFGKLAGLGATLGAGVFARGKPDDVKFVALLIAAAGGIWTAYMWFKWPYVPIYRTFLGIPLDGPGVKPISYEFSFLRLIGVGVFAGIGAAICAVITKSKGDDGNRNA